MIKAVLFDLDSTLLQMNTDEFIKTYFGGLAARLVSIGYEKNTFIKGILSGTDAMISNDGSCTNEEAFWDTFAKICGERVRDDTPAFDEFYEKDFDKVSVVAERNTDAPWAVSEIKNMGYRVALATNPVFPAIATIKRTEWAGLSVDDFELYTTYENSRFCKPNLNYYRDVISKLGLKGEECLMVGNDVDDDMVAEELGMKVFLIDKYLINKSGKDISRFPRGDFKELVKYIRAIGEKQ